MLKPTLVAIPVFALLTAVSARMNIATDTGSVGFGIYEETAFRRCYL